MQINNNFYIGLSMILVSLAVSISAFIYLQKQEKQICQTDKVNNAKILEIQQMLSEISKNQQIQQEDQSTVSGKININTADLSQLDQLPGVGPARAQDIINYRGTYGNFNSPEEIQNIKGIGPATYEKMKDMIEI